MKQHNIFITETDMEKLRRLLDSVRSSASKDQEHLAMLEGELDRANVVSAGRVPADVGQGREQLHLQQLDDVQGDAYQINRFQILES